MFHERQKSRPQCSKHLLLCHCELEERGALDINLLPIYKTDIYFTSMSGESCPDITVMVDWA